MIRLYFILFERSVTIVQLLRVSAKIQLCVHECVCVCAWPKGDPYYPETNEDDLEL